MIPVDQAIPQDGQTYVYTLADPDTDDVYYVGISSNPKRRYAQHLRPRPRKSTKDAWIASLLDQGRQPEMVVLERVATEEAREQEKFWIRRYSSVHLLTNPSIGKRIKSQSSAATIGIDRETHAQFKQAARDDERQAAPFLRRMLILWRSIPHLERERRILEAQEAKGDNDQ